MSTAIPCKSRDSAALIAANENKGLWQKPGMFFSVAETVGFAPKRIRKSA